MNNSEIILKLSSIFYSMAIENIDQDERKLSPQERLKKRIKETEERAKQLKQNPNWSSTYGNNPQSSTTVNIETPIITNTPKIPIETTQIIEPQNTNIYDLIPAPISNDNNIRKLFEPQLDLTKQRYELLQRHIKEGGLPYLLTLSNNQIYMKKIVVKNKFNLTPQELSLQHSFLKLLPSLINFRKQCLYINSHKLWERKIIENMIQEAQVLLKQMIEISTKIASTIKLIIQELNSLIVKTNY